jgi:hypothetical protein
MITRIGLLISAPAILLALAVSASGDEAPGSDSVKNLSAQVTIALSGVQAVTRRG